MTITKASHTPTESGPLHWPQGYCPKPWVASIAGQVLRDGRGAVRRFKTKEAARAAISRVEGRT